MIFLNMKQLFFNLIFFFPAFAYGQTVDYSLDMVQKDSFFVVEKFTAPPTPQEPRGQQIISYKLFRSIGELIDFVNTGLDDTERELIEAQQKIGTATETKKRLTQIKALTDKKRP